MLPFTQLVTNHFPFFIASLHVVSEQLGGGVVSSFLEASGDFFLGLEIHHGSQYDAESHLVAVSSDRL